MIVALGNVFYSPWHFFKEVTMMNKPINNSLKFILYTFVSTMIISVIVLFCALRSFAYSPNLICSGDIEYPFYYSDSNQYIYLSGLSYSVSQDSVNDVYICLLSQNDVLSVVYITPSFYDGNIVIRRYLQPYAAQRTYLNFQTYITVDSINYYYVLDNVTNSTYKNYYLNGNVLSIYTSLEDIVSAINYNPFSFNNFTFVGGKSFSVLSQYITRLGVIHSTYSNDGRLITDVYYETYLDDVLIDSDTYSNNGRHIFTYTDFLQQYTITQDSYIKVYMYPIDENGNRGIGQWIKFYIDTSREGSSGLVEYTDETISGSNGTSEFSYDVSNTDTVETGTSDSDIISDGTITIIEYNDNTTNEQLLEMLSNLNDYLSATTTNTSVDVSQYFYSSTLSAPYNYNFSVQSGSDYVFDTSSISDELSTIDSVVDMSTDVFNEDGNIFKYYFDIFPVSLWSVFLCFPTIFIIVLLLKIFVWR